MRNNIKLFLLFGIASLFSACTPTTEHVFIDNANKCAHPEYSISFNEVKNDGKNDLSISPLEVKSALMQAFNENGCIALLSSSINEANASYNTRIEENIQKGLLHSNSSIKIIVEITLHIKDASNQQNIQGIGFLDLNNEKYLGMGSTHKIQREHKTYALSIASRSLSKTLSDRIKQGNHNQPPPSSTEIPDVIAPDIIDLNK